MVLSQRPERDLVEEALAAGHISVPDEHGFHHRMYATCAHDGLHVGPDRLVWQRDVRGRHIDHIMFRCPSCGRAWQAETADIHLG